jgi:hypothetical protein
MCPDSWAKLIFKFRFEFSEKFDSIWLPKSTLRYEA